MSNEMKSLKSLKERAKEFDVRLPLMDNRDKGDIKPLLGTLITVSDYGFLPNEAGEPYAVFTIKENDKQFFFGGAVLTARLTELDAEGYGDAIRTEGLPMVMKEVKAKKTGRTYTNIEFYPED